jgi:hypothetical protein
MGIMSINPAAIPVAVALSCGLQSEVVPSNFMTPPPLHPQRSSPPSSNLGRIQEDVMEHNHLDSSSSQESDDAGLIEYPQISVTDERGKVSIPVPPPVVVISEETASIVRGTARARKEAFWQSNLFHNTFPPIAQAGSIVQSDLEKTSSGSVKVPLSQECAGLDHTAILSILQRVIQLKVPELQLSSHLASQLLLIGQFDSFGDQNPIRVELRIHQEPGGSSSSRSLKIRHLAGDHSQYDLFCQRLIRGITS